MRVYFVSNVNQPCCKPTRIQVPRKANCSWTSFVDDVKRGFGGAPETAEAGCRNDFANPFFA
jgi:hypothetical protein